MICYYQNKKTILICFSQEDVTKLLIYTTYLKAILIFHKILFAIIHREKATYGLGFKLTFTRNKNDVGLDEGAVFADARIKIDHIHWYVPP